MTRTGTSGILAGLVELLGLPTMVPPPLDREEILNFTRSDKKGRAGRPRYVLLAEPGKVAQGEDWTREVPDAVVRQVLEEARG